MIKKNYSLEILKYVKIVKFSFVIFVWSCEKSVRKFQNVKKLKS